MPIEITEKGTYFLARWYGVITAGDLVRLASEAETLENALPEPLDRIADISEVSSFEIGYPELSALAERRRARKFSHSVKSAIIATSPVQVGLARMFQTLNDNPQIEIRVLRSVEEALNWFTGTSGNSMPPEADPRPSS